MSKHTPGPWFNSAVYVKMWDGIPVLCTADHTEETPEGYTYQAAVIPAFETPSEEQLANAQLIAAAPDLYEACVAALAYLAPPASKFKENREVAADMIRKAIAKAEGRA